jgi:hypothetical protein
VGANPNPIMRFFNFEHLPPRLQEVSKIFHDVAHAIYIMLPDNAEKSTALRKLLEAKDAAVRAGMVKN